MLASIRAAVTEQLPLSEFTPNGSETQCAWPAIRGAALYPSVARMNHACAPNVSVDFRPASAPGACDAAMVATALRPIKEGEELRITYIRVKGVGVKERRKKLLEFHNFTCHCPRCIEEGGVVTSKGGGKGKGVTGGKGKGKKRKCGEEGEEEEEGGNGKEGGEEVRAGGRSKRKPKA